MKKKYLVIGDYVISKNDGQRHYVSAKELVSLYGVDKRECELFDKLTPRNPRDIIVGNLIILGPLYNGNYREYLEKSNAQQTVQGRVMFNQNETEALTLDAN